MTTRTLIRRSLRFHWRSHLGVVLGAAIGSAALIGALIVGDSVRESLRERALARLGDTHFAIDSGDRLFGADLPQRIQNTWFPTSRPTPFLTVPPNRAAATPAAVAQISTGTTVRFVQRTATGTFVINSNLVLTTFPLTNAPLKVTYLTTNVSSHFAAMLRAPATAADSDGTARANQVNLYGISLRLIELGGVKPPGIDEVILNESLAAQLKARTGDVVVLRVRKPEAVSAESPVSATDSSVALRLRVSRIIGDERVGNLSLRASQVPPYNAFVGLSFLQSKLNVQAQANELLVGDFEELATSLRSTFIQQWARKLRASFAWTRPKVESRTNALPHARSLALLERALRQALTLEDLQIDFRDLPENRGLEMRSARIFIRQPLIDDDFVVAQIGRQEGRVRGRDH